jgi:hypothetical protein
MPSVYEHRLERQSALPGGETSSLLGEIRVQVTLLIGVCAFQAGYKVFR